MEVIRYELDGTGFVSFLTIEEKDGRRFSIVIEYDDDADKRRFDAGTGPGQPFSDEIMARLNEFCDRLESGSRIAQRVFKIHSCF